jgi:hypothetical protein
MRQCLSDPGLRLAAQNLPLPPAFARSTGDRLLPRPLFVSEKEALTFAEDLIGLFGLITSLPELLFDGDLDRYCAALRLDDRRSAFMRSLGGGTPPLYGRADMYHDGTRFRVLEYNIASELGGIDRAGEIPRAMLGTDAFAAFADAEGLTFTHTGERVARTLRMAGAAVAADGEPTVALIEAPGGMAVSGVDWLSLQETMRGLGLDFLLGEIGDLTEQGGALYLDGRKVDVILRTFSVEEMYAHPDGEALVAPVLRAHREGAVALWTPMESSLFGNKTCLGLLSDPRTRAKLPAADRELLDRVLPWTRSLAGDLTRLDDAVVARCLQQREGMILKPNGGYGGAGVVAGWECGDAEWERALRASAADGCIVQQRVTPRREPVVDPSTGAVQDWQAAWGLFVTPDGYAGTYARLVPAGERAVIGANAGPNARIAGVFTTPE